MIETTTYQELVSLSEAQFKRLTGVKRFTFLVMTDILSADDALIKDKRFALPGRKTLLKSDSSYEVILVDASESPVERPKKDSDGTSLARRSGTLLKASWS